MSKVDICVRLRLAPAHLIGKVDEDTYWACHEAADEIERLRLTDAEREAVALAKSRLGTSDGDWQADDVLAALLERLG
jgi:hypothetical protein